jgi:hypothetical protein
VNALLLQSHGISLFFDFEKSHSSNTGAGRTSDLRLLLGRVATGWRRECQSIIIDVKAVFHFSTWDLRPGYLPLAHAARPLRPKGRFAPEPAVPRNQLLTRSAHRLHRSGVKAIEADSLGMMAR